MRCIITGTAFFLYSIKKQAQPVTCTFLATAYFLFLSAMKKKLMIILGIVACLAALGAWLLFGPATAFDEKSRFLYITNAAENKQQVQQQLEKEQLLRFPGIFMLAAGQAGVWDRLKPGRFEIKKGESVYDIVRKLRNNTQAPVRLTINKLRIKEDFAKLLSKNFNIDSTEAIQFFTNNDSLLHFDRDTNSLFTILIPATYLIKWNTSLNGILQRLRAESEKFWEKDNRLQHAADAGLTPLQVYTIASIIEEETNKNDEKGNIASVYINRMNKGMPLGADPTIKYALRDFGIKRILFGHLDVVSPYNTYRNKGLPPGPICTPSKATIDAVLNAPKTDYLFFVAKSDFSGYHHFSNNFAEHEQYARQYQKALNEQKAKTK